MTDKQMQLVKKLETSLAELEAAKVKIMKQKGFTEQAQLMSAMVDLIKEQGIGQETCHTTSKIR